jgi:outer membrane protein assembly factor BamB
MRLLVFLVSTVVAMSAADWPQWRGPFRNGHSADQPLASLPPEPAVIWKIKAGPGLASPVVAGETVIIFDAAGNKEVVRALNRKDGSEKWRAVIDETFHDTQGPDGPRCTPMINDGRVYAVSCRGQLDCLDLATGKKIWGVSYTENFGASFIGEKGTAPGASRHGNNGTPLIVGDRLYAFVGSTNGAGVVCFDKRDGKVIWKSQNDQAAYAPPTMLKLAGVDQLVCFMADGLLGLNSENGNLLWRVPIKTAFARHVTAPIAHEDVVVVSSHQVGLIGTRISREGNGFKAEQAWLSRSSAINFASPVQVGRHLYGLGPRKNVICVDILTGEERWSKEGYFQTSADKSYAGFIVTGERILMLTDGGLLALFKATPDAFAEVATAQLAGLNWCNPALSKGQLFLRDGIRGDGDLLCFNLDAQNGTKN